MATVKNDIKEIKAILKELDQNSAHKAKLYEKLKEQIGTIKMGVSKVNVFFDSANGNFGVKVEYTVPAETVYVTNEGEVLASGRFKNINAIDMISFTDMEKIQSAINTALKKTNNK